MHKGGRERERDREREGGMVEEKLLLPPTKPNM
jgi:hypothetical protein